MKQVRLCGFGGQGIILAGVILGNAGVKDGKWVAGSSSYGGTARGGECRSDIILADKPITFPKITKANILIAMSQSAYDAYIKSVESEMGVVVYDEHMVSPKDISQLKHISVPATNLATTQLRVPQVATIVILGAAVAMNNLVSKDALVSATIENVPERFREINVKAVNTGFNLLEAARKSG